MLSHQSRRRSPTVPGARGSAPGTAPACCPACCPGAWRHRCDEDDLIHLLGDDHLRDRRARDLLAVDGGDLVGGAHDAVDAGGGDLGLPLGQVAALLLQGAMGVGGVNRLGGERGGARRDRDTTATASARGVDTLVRGVGTGCSAVIADFHGGVGAAGDRHRQGQGRQAGAQRDGTCASALLGRLLRVRLRRPLGQGVGVAMGGGSHGETSFQSMASATVVE